MGRPQPTGEHELGRLVALVAERVRLGHTPDAAVPALRRALENGATIPEVAASIGVSERTLRRRSIAAFGSPPKTLQRILRFQRALASARSGVPLATVAHECGYADQAHLAGEVRSLAGVPITQL